MNTYTTDEICQICGISRKQLRYYEEKGLVKDVRRQEGNNYREYTQDHIYQIVSVKALSQVNVPLKEMEGIIHGDHMRGVQKSLRTQLEKAREEMEEGIRRYELSFGAYSRLTETMALLKFKDAPMDPDYRYEIVERAPQDVITIPYRDNWEDDKESAVTYLPRIQELAAEVNAISYGGLIYLTYDHFNGKTGKFDHMPHDFKIAVPVLDKRRPSQHYEQIPAIHGVSAIHVGAWKGMQLHDTYQGLLSWAMRQGYALANWSVEEWLISPLITNNKDLWVIQITIPFAFEPRGPYMGTQIPRP